MHAATHVHNYALQTLLNNVSSGCYVLLPVLAFICFLTAVACVRIVMAPDYAAKKQLRAWELLTGQRLQLAQDRAAGIATAAAIPLSAGRSTATAAPATAAVRRGQAPS